MSDDTGALFRLDGDWFMPSELTRGPWRADAMHGGPPGALVGWAIDRELADGEQVARITIDLIAPVPIEPLRTTVDRLRVSHRVTHLSVELATNHAVVCRAHAVVLRGDPLPPPAWSPPWDAAVPGPDLRVDLGPGFHGASPVFHRDAVEHRVTHGSISGPGPCVSWASLTRHVVAGETTPPLCGLLGVADFGSAIAQPLGNDQPVSCRGRSAHRPFEPGASTPVGR